MTENTRDTEDLSRVQRSAEDLAAHLNSFLRELRTDMADPYGAGLDEQELRSRLERAEAEVTKYHERISRQTETIRDLRIAIREKDRRIREKDSHLKHFQRVARELAQQLEDLRQKGQDSQEQEESPIEDERAFYIESFGEEKGGRLLESSLLTSSFIRGNMNHDGIFVLWMTLADPLLGGVSPLDALLAGNDDEVAAAYLSRKPGKAVADEADADEGRGE